jgi:hypothetical protein
MGTSGRESKGTFRHMSEDASCVRRPGQTMEHRQTCFIHSPSLVCCGRPSPGIVRTLIRYYSDKEEWDQEIALEQEVLMEENMAAWESVLDDYDGLLNADD